MAAAPKPNGSTTPKRSGRIPIGGEPAPAEPVADPRPEPAASVTPEPTPAPEPAPSARDAARARAAAYRPPYPKSARRPAEQRESAFQGLAWMLEGITGVVEELRHSDLGLSEEFWVHAYAARRESLLALRTVVDQLIEQVEAADRQEEERRQRRERRGGIEIQDE